MLFDSIDTAVLPSVPTLLYQVSAAQYEAWDKQKIHNRMNDFLEDNLVPIEPVWVECEEKNFGIYFEKIPDQPALKMFVVFDVKGLLRATPVFYITKINNAIGLTWADPSQSNPQVNEIMENTLKSIGILLLQYREYAKV